MLRKANIKKIKMELLRLFVTSHKNGCYFTKMVVTSHKNGCYFT